MIKKALRQQYREKRAALSSQAIKESSCKIIANIQQLLLAEPCNIHLFLPIQWENEVDLTPLLEILWQRGDHIFVPRLSGKSMEHVVLTQETKLITNRWGIPEPDQDHPPCDPATLSHIDIILTPLLICDENGQRVGYGGGYYDRFFPYAPNAQRIGVGFFAPIKKINDTYAGDMVLDMYVSPFNIIRF